MDPFVYACTKKKKEKKRKGNLDDDCFVQINSLENHRVYSTPSTKIINIQIRGILVWCIY